MQKACEKEPSTMAAILGLDDAVVEEVCASIEDVVVPANYNSPGQLVISGSISGINKAIEELQKRGAKRAIKLVVGGAFHSPLMEPARIELAEAIEKTNIQKPVCPIYQNYTAQPETDPVKIKQNLIAQLTAPVKGLKPFKI
jgi:[acyl-carrier-protein] S-malonyltransferase